MEKNIPVSQREHYVPSRFTQFLWWLSTAEKELLQDAVIDRNRYSIIGMTVLATWAFATLAWTYFFSTVTNKSLVAYTLGIFMGFIILTIDRALIKGISRQNKNRIWPLIFRGMLAVTIGGFLAQPALLYLFKKEIKLQTAADNELKKIENLRVLDSMYYNRKAAIIQQKATARQELAHKYELANAARQNFLAEADGSGGTGKIGISTIAMAKQKAYETLEAAYQQRQNMLLPEINELDQELKAIEAGIVREQQAYAQQFNDGFLTQIAALNNLMKNNAALQLRYYLLAAILLLIELMPVLAKSILPSGTYDEKLQMREELEKSMAGSNIRREQELKEHYNNLALQGDREAITAFFAFSKSEREEKIRNFSSRWKNDNNQSFDGLWEKLKKEILSKQEN